MIYHCCRLLPFFNQRIILKLAGEQSVFDESNRALQSSTQTFLSNDAMSMDFSLVFYYSIHTLIALN